MSDGLNSQASLGHIRHATQWHLHKQHSEMGQKQVKKDEGNDNGHFSSRFWIMFQVMFVSCAWGLEG